MQSPDPLLIFFAGALTTLAPCILPILPMIVNSAFRRIVSGPIALTSGMAVTFVLIGLYLPWLSLNHAIDRHCLRLIGSNMLIIFGLALLLRIQVVVLEYFCTDRPGAFELTFIRSAVPEMVGMFSIGVCLGLIWNPCSASLGAVQDLARQPNYSWKAAGLLVIFGLGAAMPLCFLAIFTRLGYFAFKRLRKATSMDLHTEAEELRELDEDDRDVKGSNLFACTIMSVGALVLSNSDKYWEARILNHLPEWVIQIQNLV
jgi:cytochrome c biogenesis protein CcdA